MTMRLFPKLDGTVNRLDSGPILMNPFVFIAIEYEVINILENTLFIKKTQLSNNHISSACSNTAFIKKVEEF